MIKSCISENDIYYNIANLKQIVFEVTDKCNLNCKYCAYSDLYNSYDDRNNQMLSFEKVKLLLDYLINIWSTHSTPGCNSPVSISFYGGEPLLNTPLIKRTIEYLESCKDVGKRFFFFMTTNGMCLDKYMDYLVEKEFRLLISLDGDEFNDSYRVDHSGKNSFNRVFNNIKKLENKYPSYFNKFVKFNAVLHNRNSVENICSFYKENFNTSPLISPLSTYGININKIKEFSQLYQNISDSIFQSDKCSELESELFINSPRGNALTKYLFSESENIFSTFNSLFLDKKQKINKITGTCVPFEMKMFISVNGKILPCERIDHKYFYGNINNNVNLDFKEIADSFNMYLKILKSQCDICGINSLCGRCIYQFDNLLKSEIQCNQLCTPKKGQIIKSEVKNMLIEYPFYYEKIMKEIIMKS